MSKHTHCIFSLVTSDDQKCPLGLEEVAHSDKCPAVRHCPCSIGNPTCPTCVYPDTRVHRLINDPIAFRNAYLADLQLPIAQRRYQPMVEQTATVAPEPDDGPPEGRTITGLTLYERIPDPMAAVNMLGTAIAKSKMFGCPSDDVGLNQGRVIAMTCLAERITPFDFLRRYHIMGGKATMQANAMLAEFVRRGGEYEIISATADKAEVLLKKGHGRGQKTFTSSITWEEATGEPWPWNNDAANGKVKKRLPDGTINPNALKTNWATPRARANMLWARAISEGVRRLDCTVNHGVYTPEEVSDYAGITYTPPEANVSPVIQPTNAPAEQIVEAEYVPATESPVAPTAPVAPTTPATPAPPARDPHKPAPVTPEQIGRLQSLKTESKVSAEVWKNWLSACGVASAKEFSQLQASDCEAWLKRIIEAGKARAETPVPPAPPAATEPTREMIRPDQIAKLQARKAGVTAEQWKALLAEFGVASAKELTALQATTFDGKLQLLISAAKPATLAQEPPPFDATNATAPPPVAPQQLDTLKKLVTESLRMPSVEWKVILSKFNVTSAKELNGNQADILITDLTRMASEQAKRDELSAWADSATAKN